ncbi:hypothetical protein ABZZ17_22930 [Streptomyces sp. NPDC006512]
MGGTHDALTDGAVDDDARRRDDDDLPLDPEDDGRDPYDAS